MERGRVQLLLREAIKSAKSGNKTWARECLGRILRAEPHNEEAWLWMSAVLETAAEKRFCLEKVLSINPNSTQAQAGLRYMDKQAGMPTSEAMPERTICPMCGEPNDPQAFQCTNCGQDLFVACPACSERVDVDRSTCANCGLEIGQSTDGASYFFHLGQLYLQHGQPKRALEAWDKTLLLNPDYPGIADVAAEAFQASGQRDLAIQSIQRALDETTDEVHKRDLRLRLACFHRDTGNLEEAGRLYQELLKFDQEHHEPKADVYTEMGRYHQKRGDTEAARHYYEMALAVDENLYDVHYALAEILLEEGYEFRALNEFRRLQDVESKVAEQAKARVLALRPPLSEEFCNRWQETIRGMTRYFVAGLLLVLLMRGHDLASISPWNLVGTFVLLCSGFFITVATVTPRNIPTLAKLSQLTHLADGPLMVRLRSRRQKGDEKEKGPARGRPIWLQRLINWQTRSARTIVATLRVAYMRSIQQLHRLAEATARTWDKLKVSRFARFMKSLPQTRFFRSLAALGKKPFFQACGRFFRRIFKVSPRVRTGPSFLGRIGQAVRGGGKRLLEQAGRAEISELQLRRGISGLVGLVLLSVGAWLVLI